MSLKIMSSPNLCVCVRAHIGQSQLIDLLVSKGAPVNATDYHALTPLHLACQRGYQGVTVSHTLLRDICLCAQNTKES